MPHYLPHQHPALHGIDLDPRVKTAVVAALVVMVITAATPVFPLATGAAAVTLCLVSGVSPRRLLLRFVEPAVLAAAVVLMKTLFGTGAALGSVSFLGLTFTAHAGGLRDGALIASRIFGAVSAVTLLAFTTSFTEMMATLAWYRVPRGLVDVAMFAWRYLFLLFEDAQVVYSAQRTRLGYQGWRRGLGSFGTLAGTLVVKAFDSSQAMTIAMVQRGYDGTLPLLRQRPLRPREVVGCALFILLLSGLRIL